jgi:hypothetical protein
VTEKIQANELSNGAKAAADAAKENPWLKRLARLGYATRGLLYGMIGVLAIQLMLTGAGEVTDREGVLKNIAGQPFGELLLLVIAIGLAGLALWGFIQAAASHDRETSGAKRIARRVAHLVFGASYGALLVPAINMITGPDVQQPGADQAAEQAAAGILTFPWGPWMVGGVGLLIVGLGLYQFYRSLNASFEKQFDRYKMSAGQCRLVARVGRIGIFAMGIILITCGTLAVLAAVKLDPHQVGGIDAALTFLLRQPYGRWLLGGVAAGVLAYAAYSMMGALWFRLKE